MLEDSRVLVLLFATRSDKFSNDEQWRMRISIVNLQHPNPGRLCQISVDIAVRCANNLDSDRNYPIATTSVLVVLNLDCASAMALLSKSSTMCIGRMNVSPKLVL